MLTFHLLCAASRFCGSTASIGGWSFGTPTSRLQTEPLSTESNKGLPSTAILTLLHGHMGWVPFKAPLRYFELSRVANMAVDLAPFGRWTLRDRAVQRR
jgi:hypothetical protein